MLENHYLYIRLYDLLDFVFLFSTKPCSCKLTFPVNALPYMLVRCVYTQSSFEVSPRSYFDYFIEDIQPHNNTYIITILLLSGSAVRLRGTLSYISGSRFTKR